MDSASHRSILYRKRPIAQASSDDDDDTDSSAGLDKATRRRLGNREAARRSRQKKLDRLEDAHARISELEAENAALRAQLASSSAALQVSLSRCVLGLPCLGSSCSIRLVGRSSDPVFRSCASDFDASIRFPNAGSPVVSALWRVVAGICAHH